MVVFYFLTLILIIDISILSGCGPGLGQTLAHSIYTNSEDEDRLLAEFRELVEPLPYREFMKSDGYLIRWLKETDFDVYEALKLFTKFIDWRRDKNIDMVVFEDFSLIDSEYHYTFEYFDKDGRPLAWGPIGTYDLRKTFLTGAREKYRRFMLRMYELFETHLHQLRATNLNVTQMVAIYDFRGFNLRTHACVKCMEMIPDAVIDYGKYPGLFYKAYVINCAKVFDKVLNVGRKFMSEATKRALNVFGFEKDEWTTALHEQIPLDQLPVEYGGSKPSFHSKSIHESQLKFTAKLVAEAQDAVRRDMPHSVEDTNPAEMADVGSADEESWVVQQQKLEETSVHKHTRHPHHDKSPNLPESIQVEKEANSSLGRRVWMNEYDSTCPTSPNSRSNGCEKRLTCTLSLSYFEFAMIIISTLRYF